jgi:hypothetical protein
MSDTSREESKMRNARSRIAIVAALAALTAVGAILYPGLAGGGKDEPANKVLARALAIARGEVEPEKYEMPLSAGVMQALLAHYGDESGTGVASLSSSGASSSSFVPPHRSTGTNGCPNVFSGDSDGDDGDGRGGIDNIRVNQDCTLRRQAEEWVGVNPKDFDNVLAGQNDNVVGFNHCGYDWSLDRGKTWGSVGTQPPPFYQELFNVSDDTADACSDPAGTFDHLGNAYITGVFFEFANPGSSIWVAKSNYPIKGRFYHVPDDSEPFQEYMVDEMGEPANETDPDVFHDKELMIADARPDSSKKGNVYVTWTRFNLDTGQGVGAHSPIVFSQSTDGGATWSDQVIISGSGSFCTDFSGSADPNACDQDQGSHPVVGPDGTIYVIFANGNTPEFGINQVLMVKCPPSEDCNDETDWTPPVRVGDLIGTHPFATTDPADPVTGCPFLRQCLPPNGYRALEAASMSISVDRNGDLYAVWADHRNNTNPDCGLIPIEVASPPCDHDIFYAHSTDGGATWSPTVTVTPRTRLGETAQWQPWHDVMGDGSKVQVAFYDRHYGDCEFEGCNDITLATITRPRSTNPRIRYRRITTSSMPNLVPANNPVQAGFLGDYMWVEISRHHFGQKDTHIVWADTRPLFGPAPEEDVYYARLSAGDDDDD